MTCFKPSFSPYLLAIYSLILIISRAHSATFLVSNEIQLIQTINTANSNGEADTIILDTEIITLTQSLPSIVPDGGNSLTITGNGDTPNDRVVSAGNLPEELGGTGTHNRRVFTVDGGDLNSSNLRLEHGRYMQGESETEGGGNIKVINGGKLAIQNAIIEKGVVYHTNSLSGRSYGGGIFVREGELRITNSTVSDNLAIGKNSIDQFFTLICYGGGIYSYDSTVVIRDSTIRANRVSGGVNTVSDGGGIYGTGSSGDNSGSIFLLRTTISDNEALGDSLPEGGVVSCSRT